MAMDLGESVRTALLSAAQSLCNDFSSASSTCILLFHFSRDSSSSPDSSLPVAYEYDHSSLGPFLGRHFKGRSGIEQYFSLLQQYLDFEDMKFSDYVFDEVERVVFVRGEARFTWKETAKGWDEIFAYRLSYVEEGGKWKVIRYEVWALLSGVRKLIRA